MHDLVILTGHSAGLGRSLLNFFLAKGSIVIGLARHPASLDHQNFRQISVDLASDDIDPALLFLPVQPQLRAHMWSRITLINNAGTMYPIGPIGRLNPEAIKRSIQLNLILPMQLMNWLIAGFPQTTLRLVQISSGAAHKVYPHWAVYSSTKAALRMTSQVLAAESKGQAVDRRVLVYEPGVLDTTMQEELRRLTPQEFPAVDRFRQLHSQGQLVSPDASARELWELLQRPDLPEYFETRFGNNTSLNAIEP